MMNTYDLQEDYGRPELEGSLSLQFEDLWPTESAGDGKVRSNNTRDGGAQGHASMIRKAPCQQCGYLNDLNKIDHTGGSLDGNGANYLISTGVATAKLNDGVTHTEAYGFPGTHTGGGCACCGSRNSAIDKVQITGANPWSQRPPLGF